MELSIYQKKVFNKYLMGENIFITGPGGTGKSVLIKSIYNNAKTKGQNIVVCAMTGIASVLLQCQAQTIHSWSGIGIKSGEPEQLSSLIASNKYKKVDWKYVDILIIDEVSMMDKDMFETLYLIGQKVRKNLLPFGGIQIIMSGDFYQLPPISKDKELKYCFESPYWEQTFNNNQIRLVKIFRQKNEVYSKLLNQIRKGKIKPESVELLMECVNKDKKKLLIKPTILYPKRVDVNMTNKYELSQINEPTFIFNLQECKETELSIQDYDRMKINLLQPFQIKKEKDFLKMSLNCEEELILKKGSQVMCIVNLDLKSETPVCNGSQGIIIDFNDKNLPIVKFLDGHERTIGYHIWQSDKIPTVGFKQIPLVLSWAMTIHKSQGSTLEYAEIDIGKNIFECGQTYVALSRLKDISGLYLKSFDVNKIKVNKKVAKYYKNLLKKEKEMKESKDKDEIKEDNISNNIN